MQNTVFKSYIPAITHSNFCILTDNITSKSKIEAIENIRGSKLFISIDTVNLLYTIYDLYLQPWQIL